MVLICGGNLAKTCYIFPLLVRYLFYTLRPVSVEYWQSPYRWLVLGSHLGTGSNSERVSRGPGGRSKITTLTSLTKQLTKNCLRQTIQIANVWPGQRA